MILWNDSNIIHNFSFLRENARRPRKLTRQPFFSLGGDKR